MTEDTTSEFCHLLLTSRGQFTSFFQEPESFQLVPVIMLYFLLLLSLSFGLIAFSIMIDIFTKHIIFFVENSNLFFLRKKNRQFVADNGKPSTVSQLFYRDNYLVHK